MDDQNKNLLLATVLSFLVLVVWFVLFPPSEQAPNPDPDAVGTELGTVPGNLSLDADDISAAATGDGAIPVQGAPSTVEAAARVEIDTPSLTGSLSLAGGRIDDLRLKDYRETIDPDSPLVRLLSPIGTDAPYYTLNGWIPATGVTVDQVPGPETVWSIESGETLTPATPLVLTWDNGAGLTFRRLIEVDDKFMFHVTQEVTNNTGATIQLAPYGLVARHGDPETVNFFILHEGVVRMSDGTLDEIEYDDIAGLSRNDSRVEVAEAGWTGFTDKYWMTTLIPDDGAAFRSVAREAAGIIRVETIGETLTVAPGATAAAKERVFAGAKEWETIRAYEKQGGVQNFIDSIDWGWFFFLTKPIFSVLHWLNGWIGNMGWSIIALTFLLKALLFPLAYKSYASMAKMRELQPEMEKLKEQSGDDREKMQKGVMELYKTNKVNPAAGCLPILLQIPIFFSLYKVIFVTIELRHAPWLGWIRDLSAPDPSSILNLFGLLPWAAPESGGIIGLISLGILPILLGVSMFLQQKLNPAPPDPTQRMIFAWMPWVFMFMLGRFASGLVLYWITNNTITFIQQYSIMRMHGYHPDLVGNIRGKPNEHRDKPKKKVGK